MAGVFEGRGKLLNAINNHKPKVILMESNFFSICTPFMVGRLIKKKPRLNIAIFSLGEYPAELEKYFILHGAKSYITLRSGDEEFVRGIKMILNGGEYITCRVKKQIEDMDALPELNVDRTAREKEVLRLLTEGKSIEEIAGALGVGKRTVESHKAALFEKLHVNNIVQLVRAGNYLDKILETPYCG